MLLSEIVKKRRSFNDDTRTLLESAISPEVAEALSDWIKNASNSGVLIGGMAMSYYVKPRYTEDGDFLFLSEADIPTEVNGFKKHRKGAFEHKKTGVEIEVLTPQSINMEPEKAKKITSTAIKKDGFKIASREGIISAKLGRFLQRDKADIIDLLHVGPVDLSDFHLTDKEKSRLVEAEEAAKQETPNN